MSADRWNEALEAAADKLLVRACGYLARYDTIYNGRIVSEELLCLAKAILALREADQRGAAARELPAPSEARVAADGGIQPTNTPSCVSVPAETGINAKGDCDSVAQQPAQSAPHHPGGQGGVYRSLLVSMLSAQDDVRAYLESTMPEGAVDDIMLPMDACADVVKALLYASAKVDPGGQEKAAAEEEQ